MTSKRSPYSTRSKKVESDSEGIYVTAPTSSQAMGDHSRVKHRIRSTRKSSRIDDYRWIVYLFVLTMFVYLFVRISMEIWFRPSETLFERFIADLSRFFTA